MAPAQTAPTLSVDAQAARHAISPEIYGMANGVDATYAAQLRLPNIRWGGDGATRYNWQVDSSNAGFDWFFMGGNGQTVPVPGAGVDQMLTQYKPGGTTGLITIPIIPYVNKTAAWNCSFPVSVYGPQQATNPYVHPNGDNCGNSYNTAGTQLTDTNIYANHIDNSVALQQAWVQYLIAKWGTAAHGGVAYYQLDNEPAGWGNTHRDVQPNGATYDTIIGLGQQYAAMVKQQDPSAAVLGPSDFTLGGWIGTPSKQNNLFAGQYYLQQMAAYDAAHHGRILDFFDEHYYGGGSDDASELASTRALWDPSFNSGSWVEQYFFNGPMQLLPRFRSWIAQYYPGTRLSLSEYSFTSGRNPLVDALTEADVLGIFGREALDLANFWTIPKPTDAVANSFRLFRNFDGQGSQFGDVSVSSTSSDQGQLAIYGAQRSTDNALTLLVINKTAAPLTTFVSLANFLPTGPASVFTYSNANLAQIVAAPALPVTGSGFAYNFGAYSATLLAIPGSLPDPNNLATEFKQGFISPTGMLLNGSAKITQNRLRLTDGGGGEKASAYFKNPVSLASFTSDFSFQLTNPKADGFTFILQNQGPTAVGSPGGGLGSAGIAKSVALKFDLWNNAGEGTNSIGLYANGAAPYTPATTLSPKIDLHSGHIFNVHLQYIAGTLAVTMTDATNSANTVSLKYPINLASTIGSATAYAGFTAGTGGASATQDILTWTLQN